MAFKNDIYGGIELPKPLSSEETKKYCLLAYNGDEEARNILKEHNLRLVSSIVYKNF